MAEGQGRGRARRGPAEGPASADVTVACTALTTQLVTGHCPPVCYTTPSSSKPTTASPLSGYTVSAAVDALAAVPTALAAHPLVTVVHCPAALPCPQHWPPTRWSLQSTALLHCRAHSTGRPPAGHCSPLPCSTAVPTALAAHPLVTVVHCPATLSARLTPFAVCVQKMTEKPIQLLGLHKFVREHPEYAELGRFSNAYNIFRANMRGSVARGADGKHVNDELNYLWRTASAQERAECQQTADANRRKLYTLMRQKKAPVLPTGWSEMAGKQRLYVHADTGVVTAAKPRMLAALKARIEHSLSL